MSINQLKKSQIIIWIIVMLFCIVVEENICIAGIVKQVIYDDNLSNTNTNVSIQFESGSAALSIESLDILRLYGELLDEFPNMIMIIIGHTDYSGNERYNQILSERRAESVKQFFMSEFGIDADRLVTIGYGEKRPLVIDTTPEARAKNSRVQLLLAY